MPLDFKEATSPIRNTIDFNINTIDFNIRNNTIDFNMEENIIVQYGLHERYEHTTSALSNVW